MARRSTAHYNSTWNKKKLNDKQELHHVLCIISKSLTKNKKPY